MSGYGTHSSFREIIMSRSAYCTAAAIVALFLGAPSVHAQSTIPAKATAQCGDGSWSMAASEKGACSNHSGVKKWIGKKPRGATGRCNDGEYSMAATEQGACSGHAGVATWYKKDSAPAKKGK
jgi:hypothetical protein